MNEENFPTNQAKSGSPGQSPIRLFLKAPEIEVSSQPPSRLARLMGLHLYSNVLLTKKVRTEMNFAARLLLLVGTFEWFLWTLLFNGIYSSDIFNRRSPELPFAALTGLLFGFAVFWFERQMLTSSEKGWRFWAALGFRLCYIGAAALITSQTFELMLFKKPIQQRARQEAVRADAAKRYQEVFEAEKQAITPSDFVYTTTGPEEAALTTAKAELKKLEAERRKWNRQLANAQFEGDFATAEQLNRLLLDSQITLTALRERVFQAEENLRVQGLQRRDRAPARADRRGDGIRRLLRAVGVRGPRLRHPPRRAGRRNRLAVACGHSPVADDRHPRAALSPLRQRAEAGAGVPIRRAGHAGDLRVRGGSLSYRADRLARDELHVRLGLAGLAGRRHARA